MKKNNDTLLDTLLFECLEELDQPNINVILDFDIKSASIFDRKRISKNIKGKTFKKIGIDDKKSKFNIRYLQAIPVAIILITLLIFSSSVIAGVKSLFYYAPGIGVIEKKASSDSFVLTHLFSWKAGDESIQITGAKLDENGFSINLNGNGKIPHMSDFNVLDSSGKSFKFNAALISSSEKGWEAFLSSKNNQFGLEPEVTLQKGLEKIKIRLEISSNSSVDVQGLGLIASSNDVKIPAMITKDNDNLRISLIDKNNNGSRIIQYGSKENPVIAEDQDGKKLALSTIKTNEFYLENTLNIKNIKLTIPEITVEKNDSIDIKIDIPKDGTLSLNKEFQIDGLPTNIQSVHRDSANKISMNIDTYFKEDSTKYLKYFTFHINDNGEKLLNSSFEFILDPKHEFVTMYNGIEVSPEKSYLEFAIDNAIIVEKGKWIYNFNLNNEK
ncbi:MAG TPA: hypothetical protein VF941_04865 [Clostridia bacterium]